MLAVAIINNTEQTVYTVPAGKTAMVQVYTFSPDSSSLTIKINNTTYYSAPSVNRFSEKLVLNAGDTISVATSGEVNVFINGMEV